jgi:hypothetical protein
MLTDFVVASIAASTSTGGLFTEYFGIKNTCFCFIVDSARLYLLSACFIQKTRGKYIALKEEEMLE